MKNFIYLIIVTAVIGIFLKFYFKSDSYSANADLKMDLNEEVLDLILYEDLYNSKAFSEYKGYNYNKLDMIFEISPFDNIVSKYYGYGNLYYKRYFEFIAAKDLLCEINDNLFKPPLIDRYVMLPLISSLGENESIKDLYDNYIPDSQRLYGLNKTVFENYIKEPDEIFSDSFTIRNPYCEQTNKDCLTNSDCDGDNKCITKEYYDIFNPAYYEFHAVSYLNQAIENLNQYLNNSENEDRKFSSAVKLSLLYSKSNNIDKLKETYNEYLDFKNIINVLNTVDGESILIEMIDIEMIDLLVELEKFKIISESNISYSLNNIKNSEINKLYTLQRELHGLKRIKKIPRYSCKDIQDVMLAPEIMLTLSEINYKQSNLVVSENIMYDFWSNCVSGDYLDSRLDWMYNNYPIVLLKSFRLSMWHGSLIPQFNKYFRQQYVDDLYRDQKFENLNMAIKLWINATISFGLDDSIGNN